MTVQRFEDLKVWQEARVLVSSVYEAARKNAQLAKDYRFRHQITAAAVSVMSNVAEGFSRRSNREFTQFLFIAKGSCAEVQSLLYAALDQGYVTRDQFDAIYRQTDLVARFLSRLITYLLRSTSTAKPNELNESNRHDQRHEPNRLDEPNGRNQLKKSGKPN